MPRPDRRAALALLLALPGLAGGASAQPGFDGAWGGRLVCDAFPGVTQAPLNQPLTVTIAGGAARYERLVLTAQGQPTGYAERGEGRVGADGTLTLTGLATGRNFAYTARYDGRLGADGRGSLRGEQEWRAGNAIGMQTRSCRIGLRRGDAPG